MTHFLRRSGLPLNFGFFSTLPLFHLQDLFLEEGFFLSFGRRSLSAVSMLIRSAPEDP